MRAPGILFIRHAESVWNAAGRWQGQGNPPLSDAGRVQAERLAERLAGEEVEALVASDLDRARETAEILGAALGLVPRIEPGLRERDVGAWSGLSHAEIARRWPEDLARLRAGDEEVRPGRGESRRELRRRVVAALQSWTASAPSPREGRLAVVSHLGVLRLFTPGAELGHAETTWLEASHWSAPEPAPC